MKLRARTFDFETGGKPVVIMNENDAESLGLHVSDRVKISLRKKVQVAIIDTTERMVSEGVIATNDELSQKLKIKTGDRLEVSPAGTPESVRYIKEKLKRGRLSHKKIKAIIKDVVENRLSDIEMTAFVSALDIYGMSMDEIEALSRSMIETGKTIKIPGKKLVDKHSIGGCSGDITSMLSVPIIAASGLTIAKTSSRAITSPAGTADKMEVLANVEFNLSEIKKIIKKTNACLVWGGTLEISPADDKFIKIEYPLGIDPLMLPSILSKKKAVGSKYVLIDMPTGRGTKMKTVGQATHLANDFRELGKRLGMDIACTITYGEQPIGYAVGPALEAREALLTLQGRGPADAVAKATSVCGVLFEMVSKKKINGKAHAMKMLKSGKAYRKMQQIIEAQGGNPKVRISDIPIGKKKVIIKSSRAGRVLWTKNAEIAAIARAAGAPKDKTAGLMIGKKNGEAVKKGDTLLTIYSSNSSKLAEALKFSKHYEPIIVGKKFEERILLSKIPEETPHRKIFLLDR